MQKFSFPSLPVVVVVITATALPLNAAQAKQDQLQRSSPPATKAEENRNIAGKVSLLTHRPAFSLLPNPGRGGDLEMYSLPGRHSQTPFSWKVAAEP